MRRHRFGLHFLPPNLHSCHISVFRIRRLYAFSPVFPGKADNHFRSLSHTGFYPDGMGKSVQYLSAKIKPDSGGTLIHPSVMSGKTAFENSREVFFPDTDSAVFDDDKSRLSMRLFSLPVQPVDLNRPVLCIFQRIGQNLFKNEGKPFFVRDSCRENSSSAKERPLPINKMEYFLTAARSIAATSCV